MSTHGNFIWRLVRLFVFPAALLGQSFLARTVLADIVADQAYVQGVRQTAANAASAPEFNPYGTMAAASISPFVGTTTSIGGNANVSSASAFVSQTGGVGNPNATAKAFVDMASGTLGAYAQSWGPATTSDASESGFWDTLTFSGASGSPTGTIKLTVPGSFISTGQGSACLLVGFGLCNPLFLTPLASWPTLDTANPSEVLTAPFTIVNGSPLAFSAGLYAQADNLTTSTVFLPTANLGDPPTLSLELPTGVTFTDASGVFLTSPVPIPPAIWLFGSGLVGLLWTTRRKVQGRLFQ